MALPGNRFKVILIIIVLATIWQRARSQADVGQGNKDAGSVWNTLPSHPRLFIDKQRHSGINMRKDKVSRQLLFLLQKDAEKKLTEAKVIFPGGVSNMGTSRNVQGRIISLALAWRLFNDRRFLTRAKEELLQLAAIDNWGTGHFLDVGEASLAAGIGFDWLYDELSENERKTIAEAIKAKALLPSLQLKEGNDNSSWVNGNFNWNPVCHGGLIVGALAIAELEPALCRQVVDRGIKNIPITGDAYSPDGAFAEGPSYWSYGTSFYVLAIEALRTALGSSAGLEKIPGFLKTADYYNQMVGPTGEKYNYSDYHIENLNEPVMLWFAKEQQRPDLIADELRDINRLNDQWLNENILLPGKRIIQSRHTPLELLWWDPSLLQQAKTIAAPLHWTADGLMPIGVMRSAWNDSFATFVAIKGGAPDNSHGHMDAGSFILEADGIRWAVDLGTESYDKMRAAKLDLWNYSQNSSRWTTFRVGPEGHNILLFNNERQQIHGRGEIKSIEDKNGEMGNVADLTSLYSDKASRVIRTVILHHDKTISLQDEWTAKDSAVNVSFQWLTRAKVTKTAYGLLLEQNDRSLQLRIEQPLPFSDLTIDVEDASNARALQDSPNPGLNRIIIKTQTVSGGNGKLHLLAVPGTVNLKK